MLFDLGFNQSNSHYSLFTKLFDIYYTIILVYVDDLILTSNRISEINHIKPTLDPKFNIKDLRNLKYFTEI